MAHGDGIEGSRIQHSVHRGVLTQALGVPMVAAASRQRKASIPQPKKAGDRRRFHALRREFASVSANLALNA
ncbi:hypothetical protein QX25_14605 [Stutzerimonas stutzeri]|nr:hypothetical protein QX25_14605 [Stutzerimonas stutzeri]